MTDRHGADGATLELPEPQPRDRLVEQLASIADFFQKHASLRQPHLTVSVYADSRAELDALAGHFGQQPPPNAGCYNGAQFYVPTDAGVTVIISHHADRSAL
jgi:hypothetical protein